MKQKPDYAKLVPDTTSKLAFSIARMVGLYVQPQHEHRAAPKHHSSLEYIHYTFIRITSINY